jgi:hypothetical protein
MAEEKILKKQIEIVFLLVTKNREVERGGNAKARKKHGYCRLQASLLL